MTHARSASRFYQRHWRDCAPDASLRDLPPVTKQQLMAAFDDWLTDPRVTRAGVEAFIADPTRIGSKLCDEYFVCSTSGTTGEPGRFVHDPHAVAVYRALSMRLFGAWWSVAGAWALARKGGRLVAVVGTGGHFAGEGWTEWERRRDGVRSRAYTVLSVQRPLAEIVAALDDLDPAVLIVYPSMLALLAEEQAAGRLRLRLAFIELGGESMSPITRARAADVFGCAIYDIYSASEALLMAIDCPHGRLHVNSDWMILEPVDAVLHPTPPGELSHTVLLTNLANRVQPILRYDLGDSVVVPTDPCPCGSPLPSLRVAGRSGDVLYLVATDGRRVGIPPSALAITLATVSAARRAQIVQTTPASLRVRVEAEPGADVESTRAFAVAKVRAYLVEQGLRDVEVVGATEPPEQSAQSGKFRPIVPL
ncbi:MAG: phenylacetate--CoA ligase family protein [Myxococcales bacterium]|nr:phenylacetate--CoA ligase family protein [Myxococcales bacterium]